MTMSQSNQQWRNAALYLQHIKCALRMSHGVYESRHISPTLSHGHATKLHISLQNARCNSQACVNDISKSESIKGTSTCCSQMWIPGAFQETMSCECDDI